MKQLERLERIAIGGIIGFTLAVGSATALKIKGSLPTTVAKIDNHTVDLTQRPTMKGKRFVVISREELDANVTCITFRDTLTDKDWMMVYTAQLYQMDRND